MASLLSTRESLFGVAAKVGLEDPVPLPDPLTHFINRTSFGLREAEYAAARSVGLERWIDTQLNPESLDVSELEAVLTQSFPTLGLSNAVLLQNYAPGSDTDFVPLGELRGATYLRQLYSTRQLFEVMVEFWSNHFSVEHTDGPVRQFKTTDDRSIRQNAMGKFKDLLNANARSPAMLYYLDNFSNVRTGPNENYGRELLELHTLGVNGGYTEDDVKDVARAFTGWTFARQSGYDFVFVASSHDTGVKQVLGQTLAGGRGVEDGQDVLDMLARHPATMRFIATKLVRRFVNDTPPQALIDRVAETFRVTDGDIRAMLRTIFESKHFKVSQDQKVRRPAEYVMAVLRATDTTLTGTSWGRSLNNLLTNLSQLPFMWPAPNGYPDVTNYWINSSALINRWNFAVSAVESRFDRGARTDVAALVGSANTPETIVQRLADRVLRRALAPADRELFVGLAAAGGAGNAVLAGDTLLARARDVLAVMLCSPYFQSR